MKYNPNAYTRTNIVHIHILWEKYIILSLSKQLFWGLNGDDDTDKSKHLISFFFFQIMFCDESVIRWKLSMREMEKAEYTQEYLQEV